MKAIWWYGILIKYMKEITDYNYFSKKGFLNGKLTYLWKNIKNVDKIMKISTNS